jgi:hypothetical protein
MVREISDTPHQYGTHDIIVKVTEDGRLVSAGTAWARSELAGWFQRFLKRPPTPAEIDLLLEIWGRAGHIPVTP